MASGLVIHAELPKIQVGALRAYTANEVISRVNAQKSVVMELMDSSASTMQSDDEHWPERFCECEQCREWYLEQALEWAEYDERESAP
jgi:hypothetical protein